MAKIREYSIRQRMVACDNAEVYDVAIRQPSDAQRVAMAILGDAAQELFLVLHLSVKNKVLGYTEAARGSIDACPVDPREVFRAAIMLGASAIIIAHCHPSGDSTPSKEDLDLTARLMAAGKVLGLPVVDHLIVAGESVYSMAERGQI